MGGAAEELERIKAKSDCAAARRKSTLSYGMKDRAFNPAPNPPKVSEYAVCERILVAGGPFSLASAPEKGAAMRAVLPLAPPARAAGT